MQQLSHGSSPQRDPATRLSKSECQWVVCFWLELRSIRPLIPACTAMRWASAMARTAGHVAPEQAALGFATGMLGLQIQ
jgi:hypothetical protein